MGNYQRMIRNNNEWTMCDFGIGIIVHHQIDMVFPIAHWEWKMLEIFRMGPETFITSDTGWKYGF